MSEQANRPAAPWRSRFAPMVSKRTLLGVIGVAFVFWVFFLITKVLLTSTAIGTPSTEQAALIAANERLLQLVQWSIGTVLTLGGGLIGLNWYQSEKRYEHDRRLFQEQVNADVEKKLTEYSQHLDMLSRASILSLDLVTAEMIKQRIGPRTGSADDLSFAHRVIQAFRSERDILARRGIATLLIQEVIDSANTTPGKPGRLTEDQLREITEIAQELSKDAPDKAAALGFTLQAYAAWHFAPQAATMSEDRHQADTVRNG